MTLEGTASTKHSAPVGLGLSDPSSLRLRCLPSSSLVSTKLKGVTAGSISARKRFSLREALSFRSRSINIKISARTATTPPTIGPSWGEDPVLVVLGLEETGKVVLLPCRLLCMRILYQGKEHNSLILVAVALGILEDKTVTGPAWVLGVLLVALTTW